MSIEFRQEQFRAALDVSHKKIEILLKALDMCRVKHLVVDEDGWYSCPLSGECLDADAVAAGVCTCGADAHNKRIDDAIESARRVS